MPLGGTRSQKVQLKVKVGGQETSKKVPEFGTG